MTSSSRPTVPQVEADPVAMRARVERARAEGRTVGFVPTMGALHEGHLRLVSRSLESCDHTVVSIFVNPTQFGPGEDFDRYPRTWDEDLRMLGRIGADVVFAPAVETMYPPGESTRVQPPDVARPLEGEWRPGHFEGVCTIVAKLFGIVPSDVAFFGRKDYQQAAVIRGMTRDLNLRPRIEVVPTVREPDGLAMSSRNRYLDADQRRRALGLSLALGRARDLLAAGERDRATIEAAMRRTLEPLMDSIDYAVLADPETLECRPRIELPVVGLIAARVGSTRLIDNDVFEDVGNRGLSG